MPAHMCMRTYTHAYVYLCLCAYVCADMCMYIHMHWSHPGSKRPAETVVRTIMRAAQQSNDNLGATPPSARQSHQRDIAPDSGVEPPAIEVVASPPCEITDAPSDVPAPDSVLPQSAPHAPHPPPPLPAASSNGVAPPVAVQAGAPLLRLLLAPAPGWNHLLLRLLRLQLSLRMRNLPQCEKPKESEAKVHA